MNRYFKINFVTESEKAIFFLPKTFSIVREYIFNSLPISAHTNIKHKTLNYFLWDKYQVGNI